MLAIYRGMTGEFQKHTKIAKWTFPIWMYVAITGVIVYLFMIPFILKHEEVSTHIFCSYYFFIDSQAQCAMCKSVVESNLENGDTIGSGLNDGILYLMAMPYISLALITFLSG